MIVANASAKRFAQTDIVFAECKLNVTITLGVSLFDPRLSMDRTSTSRTARSTKGSRTDATGSSYSTPDITQEDLPGRRNGACKISAGILEASGRHPKPIIRRKRMKKDPQRPEQEWKAKRFFNSSLCFNAVARKAPPRVNGTWIYAFSKHILKTLSSSPARVSPSIF